MPDLILHPEYSQLSREIEKLRAALIVVIGQRDELKYVVCRNINNEYLLRFGELEYKMYSLYFTYLRLYRKASLIQAAINRQEKVDLVRIEEELDRMFREYEFNLYRQAEELRNAREMENAPLLTPKEIKEIKRMYRRIVKALHPDLNPSAGEREKILLERAVEAYKNWNFEAIRIIYETIDAGRESEDFASRSIEKMRERAENLREAIKKINLEIENIKSKFPYNSLDLLMDKKKSEERIKELKNIIAGYEAAIAEANERIERMLR